MKIDKEVLKWIEEEKEYADLKHPNQRMVLDEWTNTAATQYYKINNYYCNNREACGGCSEESRHVCIALSMIAILIRGLSEHKNTIKNNIIFQKRNGYLMSLKNPVKRF